MSSIPRAHGSRIRYFREKEKLTQEQLAEQSNLNIKTIQRLENEVYLPSETTIKLLSKTLQIHPANFYDLDELKNFLSGHDETSGSILETDSNRPGGDVVDLDKELYKMLEALPRTVANRSIRFRFSVGPDTHMSRVCASECHSLGLEPGNTISLVSRVFGAQGQKLKLYSAYETVYAIGDTAFALFEAGAEREIDVEAIATWIYGEVLDNQWLYTHEPGEPKVYEDCTGFLVSRFTSR